MKFRQILAAVLSKSQKTVLRCDKVKFGGASSVKLPALESSQAKRLALDLT